MSHPFLFFLFLALTALIIVGVIRHFWDHEQFKARVFFGRVALHTLIILALIAIPFLIFAGWAIVRLFDIIAKMYCLGC